MNLCVGDDSQEK